AEHPAYFVKLCKRRRLPDRVVYAEADNQLLLDFRDARGIDLFLHYLDRRRTMLVEEFLFDSGNCIVEDIAGRPFANELIIPVRRAVGPDRNFAMTPPAADVRRKFPPGSEWLY